VTPLNNTLTDVPGLKVGHAHDEVGLTGCTVVLCEAGAVGGVDQRGGAPGTRETDLLRPMHLVEQVHAVLLTGGSAFGLEAATGVMRYLEARGIGYEARVARVPIVPAAVLFDLDVGSSDARPDAEMGYAACEAASDGPVAQGCVGAGMGARVGGVLGVDFATKSGLGSASVDLGGGLRVGALVAVNAAGDVVDPGSGEILAGARQPPSGKTYTNALELLKSMRSDPGDSAATASNTVIGVVASNAILTKEGTNKVAQMAQDGLARVIQPAHTMFDGDTIFALSTGEVEADVNLVGAYAAEVMAEAILNAVQAAVPLGGLPSHSSQRSTTE
jgi:L-aminopeptidase/D-esterase-like protein